MESTWLDVVEIFASNNTNIWLITTIFLVSYIGIRKAIGLVCWFKEKKPCEDKKDGVKCIKLAQKDYTYLVVIILIVSIFLISMSLYTNEEAMDLFSFTSTITSIILSVIAIILTITSDTKSISTKEKLEDAAKQIQETTNMLKEASESIDPGLLKSIGVQTNELKVLMENAMVQIESILKTSKETQAAIARGPGKVVNESFDIDPIKMFFDDDFYDDQAMSLDENIGKGDISE